MNNERMRVLRARWIFPVSSPPIHGGWIQLQGNKIVALGSGIPPSAAEDFGDVAILPGLVNAHTHLEFSDCDSPIGQPGTSLADWVGQVIAARRDTTVAEKAAAIERGLAESQRAGMRLIGEITTPPSRYEATGDGVAGNRPELVTFAEVLGLTPERGEDRKRAATDHFRAESSAAWSPHAPYSTSRPLVQWCVERAQTTARPLAMHVAESPAERELLTAGTGPFAAKFRELGVWQEGHFPWGERPFEMLLDLLAAGPKTLLIHGNDLRQTEIDHLRQYRQMSVVFCPRTHHFFAYDRHPVDRLLAAGITVALGTDSRASNPDLNLWREAQFLWCDRDDLAPHDVLKMATLNGALALGRADVGQIAVGCRPELGFVRTEAAKIDEVYAEWTRNPYEPLL